jgi:hypothetical protein
MNKCCCIIYIPQRAFHHSHFADGYDVYVIVGNVVLVRLHPDYGVLHKLPALDQVT